MDRRSAQKPTCTFGDGPSQYHSTWLTWASEVHLAFMYVAYLGAERGRMPGRAGPVMSMYLKWLVY